MRPGLSVIAQLASGSGLKIQGSGLGSGLGLGLGLLSRAELGPGGLGYTSDVRGRKPVRASRIQVTSLQESQCGSHDVSVK